MQYSCLPKGVCDDIEKIQRGFVWGDTEEKRKPHLVKWGICCLPRKDGGLGLKKPRHMNEAFMMKLLWNLLSNPNDLWCQVLINKYGRGHDLFLHMGSQPTDSPLWKGIQATWTNFMRNVTWKVGNGRSINFWLDKWLPGDQTSLMSHSNDDHVVDATLTLFDFTDGAGNWDLHALFSSLPDTIINRVLSLPAPVDDDGPDCIGWHGSSTLSFSTKSAYESLCRDQQPVDGDWKCIWKWKGPHRIQTFMWLVAHGRLLTNSRRHRWSDTISPICQACNQVEETQMHALRDCIYATRVWLRLLPSIQVTKFFEASDTTWVFDNLDSSKLSFQRQPWQTVFMVTTWYLWQWRNQNIFEEGFQRPYNQVEVILKLVGDIDTIAALHRVVYSDVTNLVHWKRPDEGWVKLNSDGSSRGNDNQAGCGGLLRNPEGDWLVGYTKRLGVCNALQAEMWGVWLGITLAKQRGVPKLIVESDSKTLVDLLTSGGINTTMQPTLVTRIRKLLEGAWEVKIIHTWREGNMCADWLARYSFQHTSMDTVVLDAPPEGLLAQIANDVNGAPVPRQSRIRY